ncbi:hypothetical protein D4764_06G0006930 [Takifugu flavidus]|uniref:Uncharacterized protein n=1 Tax=Takifugu flavidus TaxID=433684 RepID=A0A5C6MVY0_9TELE|nr:hypothetical protein D4764_06G0006930 [Takifugu flavidus]
MAYGQAPGLDGLSTDFYKHFWRCLGADLWEVLQECTQMVVGQWQPEENGLLSLRTSVSLNFESVGKKDLYLLAIKDTNLHSLAGLKA